MEMGERLPRQEPECDRTRFHLEGVVTMTRRRRPLRVEDTPHIMDEGQHPGAQRADLGRHRGMATNSVSKQCRDVGCTGLVRCPS